MKGKQYFFKSFVFAVLVIGAGSAVFRGSESRAFPGEASKTITVIDNNLSAQFSDREELTVAEFLVTENIGLEEADAIFPPPEAFLAPGMSIVITRAKKLVIRVDGGERAIWTHALTVEDSLAEVGIRLEDDDIVQPGRETLLPPNSAVTVTRVEIREETEEKSIPFATKTEEDQDLSWRTKKVKIKGERGVRQLTYRVSYHDGQEVGRKQIASEIAKEPVTEVIVQGTQVKVGKKHEGLGTWYAHTGTLAAASPWLPMGSYARVTNEANGKSVIVVINDRGPFGPNRIIDLDKVAFEKIASIGAGIINVKVEEITN